MQYTGNNFEALILTSYERADLAFKARPLQLGGYAGNNGGVGGPPGGFIGYLPQGRVAYDQTEAEIWATSGISLVDNLNRIRYRISQIEGSGVGNISLDDLTDVVITSPASGQALVYNGAEWLPTNMSGGTGTPGGSNTQIQYNNNGLFAGDSGLTYVAASGILTVGQPLPFSMGKNKAVLTGNSTGTGAYIVMNASDTTDYGPYFLFHRTRGDWSSQTGVLDGDTLGRLRYYGRDDTSDTPRRGATLRVKTVGDYTSSNRGAKYEFWAVPSGNTSEELIATIWSGGIDVTTSKEFTIDGVPHRTSDGSDHSFINQDVSVGTSPEFDGENFTGIPASGVEISNLNIPTPKTVHDYLSTVQSSGHYIGGDFTDNADGSITVAAGVGAIRAINSLGSDIFSFQWTEDTNVSLVDNSTNYIYVEYNLGNPIVVSSTTRPTDIRTNVLLGKVYREGTELHLFKAGMYIPEIAGNVLTRFVSQFGEATRTSGGIISETGTRNLAATGALLWGGLTKKTTIGYDTSVSGTFEYYYYDGTDWVKNDETQIDNLQYNDITSGLETLSWNRYGVHWVYLDIDGHMLVVYGQDSYRLSEAEEVQPPDDLPSHITEFAFLAAKVIIKKDDAAFTEIQSAYDIAFTSSVSSEHNELAGLQGGTADEYYHLTSDEVTDLANNTAKETNATHTGEVTGSEELTITDNVVDEANLKMDTSPTDGYVLTANSGESGGMKWVLPVTGIENDEATLQDRMFAGRSFDDGFDYDTLPSTYHWAGSPFISLSAGTGANTYSLTTYNSSFWYDIRSGNRSFLYRSGSPSAGGSSNGGLVWAGGLGSTSVDGFTGIRLDDGTDNNYVESGLTQLSGGNWAWQIRHRSGGGTVTKVTSTDNVNVPFVFNHLFWIVGTKWSSWTVYNYIAVPWSSPAILQMKKVSAGANFTFTPSRYGIVIDTGGGSNLNIGTIDHWGEDA